MRDQAFILDGRTGYLTPYKEESERLQDSIENNSIEHDDWYLIYAKSAEAARQKANRMIQTQNTLGLVQDTVTSDLVKKINLDTTISDNQKDDICQTNSAEEVLATMPDPVIDHPVL